MLNNYLFKQFTYCNKTINLTITKKTRKIKEQKDATNDMKALIMLSFQTVEISNFKFQTSFFGGTKNKAKKKQRGMITIIG